MRPRTPASKDWLTRFKIGRQAREVGREIVREVPDCTVSEKAGMVGAIWALAVRLPAGVTPALGCADGQVSIQVKAGAKTISTRRADVRRDCSFSSTVRFADRRRFTRNGRLRFTLRFTGNEVLNRSAAIARNIRTRS